MIFMCGCITEYDAKEVNETVDILIVDGTITNDTTYITLSKAVPLTDEINDMLYINNATLYVECNDGTQSINSVAEGQGKYLIKTGKLNDNYQYRLKIFIDEKEYQSEYLSPLITPEIDSISLIKAGKGKPVYICVSARDSRNQSPYYLWSYKEDWEFKTRLRANAFRDNGIIIAATSQNNRYYCWQSDRSHTLLLGETSKLNDNIISEKKLIEMDPSDDRLSELYHISVTQNLIRKEAYDYYANLQKNIEQTGSLFSPIPSEMRGNIICVANPEMHVVGYVEVSTTSRKKRFIWKSEEIYEEPRSLCQQQINATAIADALYIYDPLVENLYAPRECVDCTVNGTKTRPDFWPDNGHY